MEKIERLREQEKALNAEWIRCHKKSPRRAAKIRERYFKTVDRLIREYDRLTLKAASQEAPRAKKAVRRRVRHGVLKAPYSQGPQAPHRARRGVNSVDMGLYLFELNLPYTTTQTE